MAFHIRRFKENGGCSSALPGRQSCVKTGWPTPELTSTDKQNWLIPKDRPKKRRIRCGQDPAGTVLVKLTDEHGRELHGQGTAAKLEVLTANIGDEELRRCSETLACLPITSNWPLWQSCRPSAGPVWRGQIGASQGRLLDGRVAAAPGRLCSKTSAVITKRPLREIKVGTGINRDYYQVRSPQISSKPMSEGPTRPSLA